MGFFIHSTFTEVLISITTLFVLILGYFYNRYQYWTRKGVPTKPPKFPLGNNPVLLPKGFALGIRSKAFYDYFKQRGHKFGGIYLVTEPNLVVVDPEYVKDILTKDFSSFTDRGFYSNAQDDPISANLFSVDGPQWKQLRVKLTPTFTSSKMKTMFQRVVQCCGYMSDHIERIMDGDIDIKEVMGRYTTDCIGGCAFGVECNSFEKPDAEFRKMGIKIFHFDLWRMVRAFCITNFPTFSKSLHLTANNRDVREFFVKLVSDTIRFRQEHPRNRRNDFLQILIDLNDSSKMTISEMAAQSFLFFLAGFESSSTAMSFALYHLARNEDYQEKVRLEVCTVLEKYDGQMTYESLSEMKYLGQVFDETLRMYSPPTLNRRVVRDYRLRDTNIVLEKGTPVLVSVMGLHMDPDYYPDPGKFDPERFSDEMKKGRPSGVYLPFGDGPRNCIGLRFGSMQSKAGIASVIRSFRFTVSPETKPLRLDPNSFLLRLVDKIYLRAARV